MHDAQAQASEAAQPLHYASQILASSDSERSAGKSARPGRTFLFFLIPAAQQTGLAIPHSSDFILYPKRKMTAQDFFFSFFYVSNSISFSISTYTSIQPLLSYKDRSLQSLACLTSEAKYHRMQRPRRTSSCAHKIHMQECSGEERENSRKKKTKKKQMSPNNSYSST